MFFHYRFEIEGGEVKEFHLELDGKNLRLDPFEKKAPPEWTRIGNHKCPNCPLREAANPHCPVAANLVEIIHEFRESISYQKAVVRILTPQREYLKKTSLQNGISSLIGIVMVTSGCPILDRLRPMVYTHLPFATPEETIYRVISMYLMAQFFRFQRGQAPDWDLKGLVKTYNEISVVNQHFAERLKTMPLQDASLNALVNLSCFASFNAILIADKALESVESLFQAYLK
jgi:hypothetical protein